jgi:putative transposase
MRRIDEIYTAHPYYGYRRITAALQREGDAINEKRIRRLMKAMGIEGIHPKPRLSMPGKQQHKYPYLLRGVEIERKDQAWSTDITYIPTKKGFLYLVGIMDWFSRYVLSWELSNSLDDSFCIEALDRALTGNKPEIFNSDQGSQFTGKRFTAVLEGAGIQISWDGRGRALDNVFIERLWRSLKYEEVYTNCYETAQDAILGISKYMEFYNKRRPHQSLGYKTPYEVYLGVC